MGFAKLAVVTACRGFSDTG